MKADMAEDVFAQHGFGKAALAKMGNQPENFRLYAAGWLGDRIGTVMAVTGAQFRHAKSGPNKGKLSVLIRGTKKTVYVSADEMRKFAA